MQRASRTTNGAASAQNVNDQPRWGSRNGKGVSPSSTIPQASQVLAPRVIGSGVVGAVRQRDVLAAGRRSDRGDARSEAVRERVGLPRPRRLPAG